MYLHAPAETRLIFAGASANGANIWYGLHCPTEHLTEPGGKAAIRTNRFLARHENLFAGTRPVARVAILHSDTNFLNYRSRSETTDFYAGSGASTGLGNANESLMGFAAMLYAAQIPFKVVTEDDLTVQGLAGCDCLILPTIGCMSNATTSNIAEYVAAGGNIVVSLDTSLFDEGGQARKNFALSDVLGIGLAGNPYDFKDFNYYEFCPGATFEDVSAIRLQPAPSIGMQVRIEGAECLARFREPLPGRYVHLGPLITPAITLNRYGNGRAMYLAGNFGEFYADFRVLAYRQLLVSAVRAWCQPIIGIENVPESLDVSVREQPETGRVIIHLINYTGGMSRPIQQVVPLRDIVVRLPGVYLKGRLVAQGMHLDGELCSGETTFRFDLPLEWEILVVGH